MHPTCPYCGPVSRTLSWLILAVMVGGLFLLTLVLRQPFIFFAFCIPVLVIIVLIDRRSSRGKDENKK
jgi:hypothetical protein